MPTPKRAKNKVWSVIACFKGKRRQLTLGKQPKAAIDDFCQNLTSLIEHVRYGQTTLPPRLLAWVNELSEMHRKQLSDLGLFDYQSVETVKELADEYAAAFAKKEGVAASTVKKVKSTFRKRLGKLAELKVSHLEPKQRSLRQNAEPVWSDEAQMSLTSFNSWQRNHYSPATWTRDNKLLASVGKWAVKQGYCDYNPFTPLPRATMENDERNEYVPAQNVLDAMEQCLSPDIRITLALGRFAGLRTCSEVRTMLWSHVDEKAGTLTVIDSKKKKPRTMPLFERIRDELELQREVTGDTRYVASAAMRRSSSSNNFTKIRQAISRSGQVIWQRTRQNLRTSCENDLLELFEERLVTHWLGHCTAVSRKHYQKLRPSDYRKAVRLVAERNTF